MIDDNSLHIETSPEPQRNDDTNLNKFKTKYSLFRF